VFEPHTILHPTDLSKTARCAYPLALEIARKYHARLLLLHVSHIPTPSDISVVEAATEPQPSSYHNRLAQEMRSLYPPPRSPAEGGQGPDVAIEYLVRDGVPADEILKAARELHCDLIVLATHGRTGLERLLLGSTAEQVIRRATCPVMTTRANGHNHN
jgi:nucleotide-binding universal stress UspA family protein